MQRVYIVILNVVFGFTGRIDERIRNLIIQAAWFFYAFLFALRPNIDDIGNRMIYCSAVLIIVLLMSIKSKLQIVKWDKATYCPMVLFGLGLFVIGHLHYVGNGYMMYAFQLVFILPAYYLVWINRDDYEVLFDRIATSFICAGVITLIYNFALAYKGAFEIALDGRAAGNTSNPNFLGMLGLTVALSAQYLSLKAKGWLKAVMLAAPLGLGVSMIVESASRTAMLSLLGCTIVLFAFIIKNRKKGDCGIYGNTNIVIISFIVMLFAVLVGLQIDDVQREAVQALTEVNSTNPVAESKEENTLEIETGEETGDASTDLDNITSRLEGSENVDEFSSGRTVVWKLYMSKMNLTGNNYKEFKKEHPELTEARAHNNFIDYAFRCGIPIATIYLVFYLAVEIKALCWLFTKSDRPAMRFFVISIAGTYALYALLEVATLTFIRVIPCLFFLSIAPLMGNQINRTEEED